MGCRIGFLQRGERFLPGFVGAAAGGREHLGLGRFLLGLGRGRFFLPGGRHRDSAVLQLLIQLGNLLFQLGNAFVEGGGVGLHRAQAALERRVFQHDARAGRPAQLGFRRHEKLQHLHQPGHGHVL